MTVVIAAIYLSVAIGMSSCEPNSSEIREFLSNTAYSSQQWHESFVVVCDKYASKQRFSGVLVTFLNDDDGNVRQGVLHAIVELETKETVLIPPIIRVLREDSKPSVRIWAVIAIHSIAGKNSINYLLPALGDKDVNVRAAAIRVLGTEAVSSVALVKKLRHLLSDTDDYSYSISADMSGSRPVRYEAVRALGEIGSKARVCLPELKAMLTNDQSDTVRLAAAVAVAQLDGENKSAIKYLMSEAVNATSEECRAQAIQGLKQLGSTAIASVSILKQLLRSDSSWLVRSECADALPRINGFKIDTVDALAKALDDYEPWVQMTALQSLEIMGTHAGDAAPAVEKLLDKYTQIPEGDLPYLNGDIRVQAVATLLAIGNRESVVPIITEILDRVKTEKTQSRIQRLLNRDQEKRLE